MKVKLKNVVAKPNTTSIIIYYSKDGKEMRFPTGITISKKKNPKGKYVDWDYTNNKVRPGITDYETSNEKINELVTRGNHLLNEAFKNNVFLSVEELEKQLSNQEKVIFETANSYITDLYELFYQSKKEQFEVNGTPQSLKDFTSTKNMINDFETYKDEKYKIYQLDPIWCKDMLNFMKIEHIDNIEKGKFYISNGKNGPKRCKKVFDIYVQFSQFLKDKKLCSQDTIDDIKRFRKLNIRVPKTEKVTLDVEEIHTLYDYQFTTEKHEIIKDVFVFLCLTGLRFEDYKKFDKLFIKKSKVTGVSVYERKAVKTIGSSGVNYKIPLCDIVIEILEKYNYKLPIPTKPNEDIKEALKETKMFDTPTNILNKSTGKEKLKYECISLHKGRDCFITNLVDHTPLNTLLKYTGHTKLSTLQGYIDPNREIDTNPISNVFNRKKDD